MWFGAWLGIRASEKGGEYRPSALRPECQFAGLFLWFAGLVGFPLFSSSDEHVIGDSVPSVHPAQALLFLDAAMCFGGK